MKTIYNTFVIMESQEQCDKMKQLCIDNGLPYWRDFDFKPVPTQTNYDCFYFYDGEFCNYKCNYENLTEITEQEFIELLKQSK